MNELDRIIGAARSSLTSGEHSALATILATEGSSFRRAGTRLWIGVDERVGAISGGCLESDLAERAKNLARGGRPTLIAYDSAGDGDVLWGTASGCGGALQILLEPMTSGLLGDLEWIQSEIEQRRTAILVTRWDGTRSTRSRISAAAKQDETPAARFAAAARAAGRSVSASEGDGSWILAEAHLPPLALTVFGGGQDARAAARFGRDLGWTVLFLGDSPSADHALATHQVLFDSRSAVLLMTHNFHRDAELLEGVARTSAGYIGVLGPRRRSLELLAREGMPRESLTSLHAPPGLDIGGETPEEIALSLLAEIQGHFAGRPGGKLRDRAAPIHDRAPQVEMQPHLAISEREP